MRETPTVAVDSFVFMVLVLAGIPTITYLADHLRNYLHKRNLTRQHDRRRHAKHHRDP